MCLNIDVAPTILDLAGVAIPDGMQGRSLMPLCTGEQQTWRTDFLYEHFFKHPYIPRSEGVRTENHKYIRYIDQQPVYEELYALRQDPYETTNLAQNPRHKEILNSLKKRCDSLTQTLV